MRFYKTKQADMLHSVSSFLTRNMEKLAEKVPAMNDFIGQYMEMEKRLYAVRMGNPSVVFKSTIEKKLIKKESVKAATKLIAVLNAAGYKVKGKPLPEMDLSAYDLHKLPADKLVKTYTLLLAAAKKIRNLQYYGLSEDAMHDMHAYCKEFSAIKNIPLMRKKERALNNKNLESGVKECIAFLKLHIDQMMLIAADEESALMNEYKAYRKVLPRSQGRPSDAESAYRKSRERKTPASEGKG